MGECDEAATTALWGVGCLCCLPAQVAFAVAHPREGLRPLLLMLVGAAILGAAGFVRAA